MTQFRSALFSIALAAHAGLTWGAESAPTKFSDTIEQRVAACQMCHGKQGEGLKSNEYYPPIGAKPAGYLYQQLMNFRDGRRNYPPMAYLVRYLPDAYLKEIAEYFAKQRPALPASVRTTAPKRSLDRGKELALRGDAAAAVPACTACHGKALTGMQPGIPGLLGLYPDYISAQLNAWRNGTRSAPTPDCMAAITSRLTGEDYAAVAAWLSSQPSTATTLPAPVKAAPTPFVCSSQMR